MLKTSLFHHRSPLGNRDPPAAHGGPHTGAGCPKGGCDSMESLSCSRLLAGSVAPWKEELCYSRFAGWTHTAASSSGRTAPCGKGPTLEQFIENCSLREGLKLEKAVENCLQWEGPTLEQGSPLLEEEATCNEP
ncbi:hypothetical protein TURU_106997 [Turdus rufiventris]|nr:hypothetical protein TURU_106997 [Turdus rufiventris]